MIARAGICSRRKAERLITSGRVRVNGRVVTELGIKVDPNLDMIEVDGKPVELNSTEYVMLNKPRGVVTTARDPRGRKTVLDFVIDVDARLFPVGRLDYATEGLLLLTNDGDLTYRITHPSYEIEKVYEAVLEGDLSSGALKALRQGVLLEDGMTAPARVSVLARDKSSTHIEIAIHEGRNRQIRRMAQAVGHPVKHLKRIAIGPIKLGSLAAGSYRRLTSSEVTLLKSVVGM